MEKSRFACMQKKSTTKPKGQKNKQKPRNTRFKSEDFMPSGNSFTDTSRKREKPSSEKQTSTKQPSTKQIDSHNSERTINPKVKLNLTSKRQTLNLKLDSTSFPSLFGDSTSNGDTKTSTNYADMVKRREVVVEEVESDLLNLRDKRKVIEWARRFKQQQKENEYLEKEWECDLVWGHWMNNIREDRAQREKDGEWFHEPEDYQEEDYDSDSSYEHEYEERDIYESGHY